MPAESLPNPAQKPLERADSSYDFVVIGGGSAGYAGARTAAELGLRTAVIDGAETLGGLCILRGCMPSKTLIASANRALSIRRAAEFGLRADGFRAMAREIRDRKRALIDDFASYRRGQLTDGRFDLHRARAKFLDARTLRVQPIDGSPAYTVHAGATLIATGSTVAPAPVDEIESVGYWTSDDVLDAEDLPGSFVVLGGGAIALEMAHYLEGIGRKVAVIQRSEHVLSGTDRDAARALEGALRERGIDLFTGTKLLGAERTERGKEIRFEHRGEARSVGADEVLLALGRTPATAGLDLGAAGVELDGRRIRTGPSQETTSPGIYAAGDVCSPVEVVHIAIQQGEVAATNAAVAAGKAEPSQRREMDYRLKLFGVFTEPQVAAVGLTEDEARESERPVLVASYPFNDHGKSMTIGETHGFVKLIAAPDGELLGACAVGPEATELIHEMAVAIHFHASAAELASIPHYHPTLSEIWTYPAEEIADQASPSAP